MAQEKRKYHYPVLTHLHAKNIIELVIIFNRDIEGILATQSEKLGYKAGVTFLDIQKDNDAFVMVIGMDKDNIEESEERLKKQDSLILEMTPHIQKMLENMMGGDPNCDHEWEAGKNGLVCQKCGGKLS